MNVSVPSFSKDFKGQIIVVGFGSIGKALLPLLVRHLKADTQQITIISPDDRNKAVAEEYGVNFIKEGLYPENYESVLSSILDKDTERGFIISVSNEVSSKALIEFSQKNNAHYVDTVVEPWEGFYFNNSLSKEDQSNYKLREYLKEIKETSVGGPTAVSCCGANPGMVSWFVKEALLNLANDTNLDYKTPTTKSEWASLMQRLGVKGVHIAEKDTQTTGVPREKGVFENTWSVEGCIAECLQPAELGWGNHEKEFPVDGHQHTEGHKSAIYLDAQGGNVKVKTWTPTHGHHEGFLVTHNEAISISDYFTVREGEEVIFRPTCHYAYHPTDATVESLSELFNEQDCTPQTKHKIFTEAEIISGTDELGVLLYGHSKNAYWYGSKLSIEETRILAPHQNATALQVSSAILAGVFYALNHPQEGVIETEEMDHKECLDIQRAYLGKVEGSYTDWKPTENSETEDNDDPWQFSNIRIKN